MLYLRKRCHITLLTPHNGNVAQTATLVCVQGGRCGEVRLKYGRYTLYTSHDPDTGQYANDLLEARRHKQGEG